MACQSVATTSANITVELTQAELNDLLSKIVGDRAREIVERDTYAWMSKTRKPEDRIIVSVAYIGRYRAIVQQSVSPEGKVSQFFTVDNGSTMDAEELLKPLEAELLPLFEKQLPRANQGAVLKRLAALGKLSNIQAKERGVTAQLQIKL